MDINELKINDVVVLELKGSIDFQNTSKLKEAFESVDGRGIKKLVLDLKEAEYIDGFILSVFVNFQRHCRKKGIKIILSGMNREIKGIFTKTKLYSLFDIYETREEAINSFES